MMFEWNDQAQAGDTIWDEFNENEDHIVPYPRVTEEDTMFTFIDYNKKPRNEKSSSIVRSTEQKNGDKNDFPAGNLESSSSFNTSEEVSAPRLDIDTWCDLPEFSAAFNNGYTDKDSMSIKLINDLHQAPNLSKERVHLDDEPAPANNGYEYKGNDSFLDCDWANIGDFDLDGIYRNEPGFGHEMTSNLDELLSPSTDLVSITAQTIPIPDVPPKGDQFPDQVYSSYQFEDNTIGDRKSERKKADSTMRTGDRTTRKTHVSSEDTINQFIEKEDKQKKLLRHWKRAEEKNKNKLSQNLNNEWSHNINHCQQYLKPNIHLSTALPSFQLPTINQQVQVGAIDPMDLCLQNQLISTKYGSSSLRCPASSVAPRVHAGKNQIKPVVAGHKFQTNPRKHSNYLAQVPDILSEPLTMTPQEKIEKLRRRQQMQAMLAIQQQQNKFDHQNSITSSLVSQTCSQNNQSQDAATRAIGIDGSANKLLSSNMNMKVEQDDIQIAPLIDNQYLEEATYYELQDALGQLNATFRLVIRDSLFRLARNVVERQSANESNSTTKYSRDGACIPVNEETNRQIRFTGVADAETVTNPIDRTVANLMFHRPSDQCIRQQDNSSRSPLSCNHASGVRSRVPKRGATVQCEARRMI